MNIKNKPPKITITKINKKDIKPKLCDEDIIAGISFEGKIENDKLNIKTYKEIKNGKVIFEYKK